MLSERAFAHGPPSPILLLLALLLDAYIGDPPGIYRLLPHPVVIMGGAVRRFERQLNRESRGDGARRVRGAVVVLILVFLAALTGWGIDRAAELVSFGWVAELLLVMTLLAQNDLYRHVKAVAVALDHGGLAEGRKAVAHIVGRNPENLDTHGVARGAIESCAENFADGVIAPVFWYVLLGLPGILAYKMINTLDSEIGHLSPRYRAFGATAARLDDAVNYLPARISAVILILAAFFTPSASPAGGIRAVARDAGNHRSLNAGWPEAAVAGALGLAIAGPRRYGETVVKDAWMGDGRAMATTQDIRRALYLFLVACMVNLVLVGVLAIAGQP